MASRDELERLLQGCEPFRDPRVALEQYHTPADLAAHLLHAADMQGDLRGRTVLDLGSGTGILTLGAAVRGSARVVGVERDPEAIAVAVSNEAALARREADLAPVSWILGDATRLPLSSDATVTAISNPPFGARRGREHADRAFLGAIAELAPAVSYTIHNAGSSDFLESFVADHDGTITHAWAGGLDVDRQFDFHVADRRTLDVEIVRVEWSAP